MEGYPSTLSIFSAGALWNSIDFGTAGGTDQRFLVAICRDQNQCFRSPVFLNAPTSHGRPFQRGIVAQIWLPRMFQTIRLRAVAQRFSAPGALEVFLVRRSLVAVFVGLVMLVGWAGTSHAQRVHEIKVEANPGRDLYRFVPANVSARPGDVLLFRTISGTPHSIVFESTGLSAPAHEALNGAMSRRAGDLSSPLLSPDGAEYRIVVPVMPLGRYQFFCLPHRAYDMRGTLQVTK